MSCPDRPGKAMAISFHFLPFSSTSSSIMKSSSSVKLALSVMYPDLNPNAAHSSSVCVLLNTAFANSFSAIDEQAKSGSESAQIWISNERVRTISSEFKTHLPKSALFII
jgi:hypothetical protein